MLIKRIKNTLSSLSLMFVFSLLIFMVIFITLAIIAAVGYFLTRYGFVDQRFYTDPFLGPIVIFGISILIYVFTRLVSAEIFMKPTHEMIRAMQELSHGNFDIHVQLGWGLLRPRELTAFCESFNETAKELRSIEILRSDFINNFSHEFKTPIVSIRGFAELLKNQDLSVENHEEYLDIIISESNRLSALATNVLNLSKIENQSIVSNLSIFNLSEQIRQSILIMESKWSQKDLKLVVNLGEIIFYSNAELLSEVWVNLLDNAIKFSDHSGKLEIELLEFSDNVIFKIKDYGCGMDAKTKVHIFDKFYQANTLRTNEGNGLGMTIVQKIIALRQGQISIESKLGKGTLITITLPKLKEVRTNNTVTL